MMIIFLLVLIYSFFIILKYINQQESHLHEKLMLREIEKAVESSNDDLILQKKILWIFKKEKNIGRTNEKNN